MHPLLKRQIRRVFKSELAVPAWLTPLCTLVSAAYEQSDIDRAMIERSLDIASQELMEKNHALARELKHKEATELQLEQSMSILHTTLNSTGDGIVMAGNDSQVEGYNKKFLQLWALPEEILAQGDSRLVLDFVANQLDEPARFLHETKQTFETDNIIQDVIKLKDGRVFDRYSAPRLVGDKKTGRVWSFRNITERHRAEAKLNYLANYDELTGLANRNLLQDRLSQSIASARRHETAMAVLFVDLDQFKFVNDSLGHSAGDELLQIVAGKLIACVRENDTVARVGGDEFVLVLNGLNDFSNSQDTSGLAACNGEAMQSHPVVIDTLQRILKSISQPTELCGREMLVSCSIGVSLYPRDAQEGLALMKDADAAMYRAKELGRNNFQFYRMELNSMVNERLELQGRLRHALSQNEFALYYQPKIDLASGRLAGVEALLRWLSPDLGLVAPIRFIPILEATGMIVEVGHWAMEKAAADYLHWLFMGLNAPRIAVNVSQLQLDQGNFVNLVRDVMENNRGGAIGLDLEITESLVMRDIETNISRLSELRKMGVQISIDDFGTGYSSLSYLSKLPANTLKIDRAFITHLATSHDDRNIVNTIISLAHSLKLKVIAEGVETEEQAMILERMDCDQIQGYLVSPALPHDEFLRWLAHYSPMSFSDSGSYVI